MKSKRISSKAILRILFVTYFLNCGASKIYAQKSDFSGLWIIQGSESISGQSYKNGIPFQMVVTKAMNVYTVRKEHDGANDKKDTIIESIPLKDDSTVSTTNSQRQRTSNYYWTESRSLKQVSKYSMPGRNNEVDFIRTDIWELSADGKTLTFTRTHESLKDAKDKWVMKGEYAKKEAGSKWGIDFYKAKSWEQVLNYAKKKNKLIFVDCYATWCVPCKKMDQEVYTSKIVGEFFDKYFISVKIQMDKTKNDDEIAKAWYTDAKLLHDKYSVNAFPTFLFFSADGQLVHKSAGLRDPRNFIAAAEEAKDPKKQYYTLIKSYQDGTASVDELKELALQTIGLGDKELAHSIANKYFEIGGERVLKDKDFAFFLKLFKNCSLANKMAETYFKSLPESQWYTRDNLGLFMIFTKFTSDFGFHVFYHHAEKVDSATSKGFAKSFFEAIIMREDVDPKLWKDGKPLTKNPDWSKIDSFITVKYDSTSSEHIVQDAQIRWHESLKDWPAYCKTVIEKVNEYGPFGNGGKYQSYNQVAWLLFEHSIDKEQLKLALSWSDSSIAMLNRTNQPDPIPTLLNFYDTRANIFYKLGQLEDAILWLEKSQQLYEKWCEENKITKAEYSSYMKAIEKMRKGEPTWPVD